MITLKLRNAIDDGAWLLLNPANIVSARASDKRTGDERDVCEVLTVPGVLYYVFSRLEALETAIDGAMSGRDHG